MEVHEKPYVEIIEQAASRGFRFRYESAQTMRRSILGVSSTPAMKTYPKIKVHGNYTKGCVIVSCVTKDKPYRAHPHQIISNEAGALRGVFSVTISSSNEEIEFNNLGILCVKQTDIKKFLQDREIVRVDPFQQGFDHIQNPSIIDLSVVRLCFQGFLYEPTTRHMRPLTPIVSNPIYDKKTLDDLTICKLSSNVAPVAGGNTLIIYCKKITKDDIKVKFFERQNTNIVWEAFGSFTSDDVFEQVIVLITPPYHDNEATNSISVWLQLVKPSTGKLSKPISFQLIPNHWEVRDQTYEYVELCLTVKKSSFISIDLLDRRNETSCGWFLEPIINPHRPIDNPGEASENKIVDKKGSTLTDTRPTKKLFYYNSKFTSERIVQVVRKIKYSQELAWLMNPGLYSNHSIVNNLSVPPKIQRHPIQYNIDGQGNETLPEALQIQCMDSVPRNIYDACTISDISICEGQDWQVQSEPILEPIIVNLREEQSLRFMYNDDDMNISENLTDFC